MPLLSTDRVSVNYAAVEAVKQVSVSIEKGQIVALIGINGAGKSSLLKALMGVVPVKSGEIFLEEERVTGMQTQNLVKRGLVLCPEGRKIFVTLSVEENLQMGGSINNGNRALLKKTMVHVYDTFPILKEKRKQIAGSLSGGQQQQLAIGRALMATPKLLLLDEPSLGLAPLVVEKIFDQLSIFRREGLSIFLIEQNVSLSIEISDYSYLMDNGIIQTHGSREVLRDSPEMMRKFYVI